MNIISLLLEGQNILFGHFVILVVCEKCTMWHEIARGEDSEKMSYRVKLNL